MIVLKAHQQNWIYQSKNFDKSKSGSKQNEEIRQIVRKMVQDLIPRRNLFGAKFKNPVFAEMHKPLNLVSSAADLLFVNENFSDSSLEEHDNDDDDESEPASFSRSDGTNLNDLDAEDKQADNDAPRGIHQNVRQADKPPLQKK